MTLALADREQSLLEGHGGPAMQLAMRLVARAAEIMGANELVPVTFAPPRCLLLCRRGACRFRPVSP